MVTDRHLDFRRFPLLVVMAHEKILDMWKDRYLQIGRKFFDRAVGRIKIFPLYLKDRNRSTYWEVDSVPEGELKIYLKSPETIAKALDKKILLQHADRYLNHEFDVYGSGWRNSNCKVTLLGTPLNQEQAQFQSAVSSGYKPIHWHMDLATNYLWNGKTWFGNVPKKVPGGDIRRVWEIGRCHHWTTLAIAFQATGDAKYQTEIENQFFDFTANNPPRIGPQWSSTMDVAIRTINWVVTWDLLQRNKSAPNPAFCDHFKKSLFEHAEHIFNHLEASPSDRANHYLSNISGLLIASLYLPNCPKTSRWFQFALTELQNEILHQFLDDGGNFEGSTNYHRLSTEMVFLCSAYLLCKPDIHFFSPEITLRLNRILDFTQGIVKPSGFPPQIGDNDSGRILKIDPIDHTHNHLLAAATALWNHPNPPSKSISLAFYQSFNFQNKIRSISISPRPQTGNIENLKNFNELYKRANPDFCGSFKIALHKTLELPDLTANFWDQFGIYVVKGEGFYFSIRCDQKNHPSMEGHCHNDIFSIELSSDDENILQDPGSFSYYENISARNIFRSIKSHFPSCLLQNYADENFNQMIFTFTNRLGGTCLYFDATNFVGKFKSRKMEFQISTEIKVQDLIIRFWCSHPIPQEVREVPDINFSPAYGQLSDQSSYQKAFFVAPNDALIQN